MTHVKLGLKDLAKLLSQTEKNPEPKVIHIGWEKDGLSLCASCGARLIRSKKSANIRECPCPECNYKRQIRYGERQGGEFTTATKQFQQRIYYSRDFFAELNAFGLADKIVDELKSLKCETVILRDRERFVEYTVPFSLFIVHSFGYGLKSGVVMHFLPLKYWKTTPIKKPYYLELKAQAKINGYKKGQTKANPNNNLNSLPRA